MISDVIYIFIFVYGICNIYIYDDIMNDIVMDNYKKELW